MVLVSLRNRNIAANIIGPSRLHMHRQHTLPYTKVH